MVKKVEKYKAGFFGQLALLEDWDVLRALRNRDRERPLPWLKDGVKEEEK